MKPRVGHIVLGLFMLMGLTAIAQNEICVIEDGHMVFYLDKDWGTEKRMQVSKQYGLDSLMLAQVLSSPSGGSFEYEGETWHIEQREGSEVELSKQLGDMEGQMNWKKDVIYSPTNPASGMTDGKGYVDMEMVIFGINKLTESVIIQYPTGRTKFILPGYKNADEVFIAGSFNEWSTSGLPLEKTSKGWEIELKLLPGKYLYKFIVDGSWISAPGNSLTENDGWGGKNSVFFKYNYKFELADHPDARKVFLAGSFNDWNKRSLKMSKTATGWVMPMFLKEGTYAYKFVVDGEWITDPDNPVVRPDGAGNFNSFMAIGDTTFFRLNGFTGAREVRLAGSFNAWNPSELIMSKTAGGWELPYVLASGNYEYKFIVDGEWITDPMNPFLIHHGDYENSFLAIDPNHIFSMDEYLNSKEVIITGNFTGWSEQNNRMVKKDGEWTFPIHLKPGKYLYKFLVDGEWLIDPTNPAYEENEFGTGNSVLWIEPEGLTP
jgi:hypothetical protein